MNPLSTYFAEVSDPRGVSNAQRHNLLEILTIALCAMLSGAQTFTDMEGFGREKQAWLKERLGLKLSGGIPSHDTFGRVLARLDPEEAWARLKSVALVERGSDGSGNRGV